MFIEENVVFEAELKGAMDWGVELIPVNPLRNDDPLNPNGKPNIELDWDVSERDVPIRGIMIFFNKIDFFGTFVSWIFDIEFRSLITDCIMRSTQDFRLKFNFSNSTLALS